MEYQNIINLLDNTSNRPFKFKKKNWVEIKDESRGMYNRTYNQIRLKTWMLRSSLFDYSNAYILVKWTITGANNAAQGAADNDNKKVIFKNYTPFINCIS